MKNRKLLSGLVLLLVIAFFSTNLLAQETQKKSSANEVDKVITKLQQKVLLSTDQTTKVRTIINSYLQGDKSSEELADAQSKVESVLDEKQKEKYDIIKNDWWKGVNKVSKSEK